jgi:molecular chaperone GrpE (heat shock protein)
MSINRRKIRGEGLFYLNCRFPDWGACIEIALNFKEELEKLLAEEEMPLLPGGALAELAAENNRLNADLKKSQSDITLQIEEIYELAQGLNGDSERLREKKKQAGILTETVIGLCDMLEDFFMFAEASGGELAKQAAIMQKNADALLEKCGILRTGRAGEPLNLEGYTVVSAGFSQDIPKGHVLKILRSGYAYSGKVIRKAAAVASVGEELNG